MINTRISLFFLNLVLAEKKKKENVLEEVEEEDGETGNVQGERGGEGKGPLCEAGFCFHRGQTSFFVIKSLA